MSADAPEDSKLDEESQPDQADDPSTDDDVEDLFDDDTEFEGFDETDWDDIPQEEAHKILRGLEALVPDILKRTLLSGISNLVMNEEGLRSLVAEKNLPKEAAGFILNQADATRREILRIASREIRIFLENMDFGGEIAKILTTLSFEVRTEVRFVPNEDAVRPKIRNHVKIKRARGKGEDDEEIFDSEHPDKHAPPGAESAKGGARETGESETGEDDAGTASKGRKRSKEEKRSSRRSSRRSRWTRGGKKSD